MLSVQAISKSFGIEIVLKDISFTLNAGERSGLVGPNGCGKTTLLRIIAGLDKSDAGVVRFSPGNLQVGYLPQGLSLVEDESVGSYLARSQGDIDVLAEKLETLAAQLVTSPEQVGVQAEYDQVLAQMEAYSQAAGAKPAMLAAFGLDTFTKDAPVSSLSGGQKTRLALAALLLSGPHLLLLDEPTNHLDLDMLEWLENWLLSYRYAILFVSHDRAFLDRVATGILDLDPLTHTTRYYAGGYSEYLQQKQLERDKQWQAYTDQLGEVARLKSSALHLRGIAKFRKGGKADSGDKFARGFFANRGLGTVGRAKHIEARIEHLLTEEKVEKPKLTWHMKMEFGDLPSSGRDVLALEDLSVGYGEKVLLRHLDQHVRFGARVALTGPNGCGKTTLLRTISRSLPPLAGRVRLGANVRAGVMTQEQDELDPEMDAFSTVRRMANFSETDARAFLFLYRFTGDGVFTPIRLLSYGERARLSLACLVARGCNFLLLDEPINHLDIPSRSAFEQAIANFEGTILTVIHDRYFIQNFASEVWEIKGENIFSTSF